MVASAVVTPSDLSADSSSVALAEEEAVAEADPSTEALAKMEVEGSTPARFLGRMDIICPTPGCILVPRMAMESEAGRLLTPRAWCRQRWCRDGIRPEHRPGDGCTCDPHGCATGMDEEPRLTILKTRASRLPAFACRACGRASKRMVEYPILYFRCEPCAAADRWPDFGGRSGRG